MNLLQLRDVVEYVTLFLDGFCGWTLDVAKLNLSFVEDLHIQGKPVSNVGVCLFGIYGLKSARELSSRPFRSNRIKDWIMRNSHIFLAFLHAI